MRKRLVYLIFSSVLIFLIAGCASDHSSLKHSSDKETSIIILAPPNKIMPVLLDLVDKTFAATITRSIDKDRGKIVFENYSLSHGDVSVTITFKSVTGMNKNGEVIKGYSLDINSQGIGVTAAREPDYATRKINDALPGVLEKYKLPFVIITNPKVY